MSCAGLASVVALAHRAGLGELVADTITVPTPAAVNAPVKVSALVAGMVAGADSIDDMDLLRHGGMRCRRRLQITRCSLPQAPPAPCLRQMRANLLSRIPFAAVA